MTKEEYFKDLEGHDWYFAYSDDHRVYRAGQDNITRLRNLALQDKVFMDMFKDFSDYAFARDLPKPKLKDY